MRYVRMIEMEQGKTSKEISTVKDSSYKECIEYTYHNPMCGYRTARYTSSAEEVAQSIIHNLTQDKFKFFDQNIRDVMYMVEGKKNTESWMGLNGGECIRFTIRSSDQLCMGGIEFKALAYMSELPQNTDVMECVHLAKARCLHLQARFRSRVGLLILEELKKAEGVLRKEILPKYTEVQMEATRNINSILHGDSKEL